MHAKTGTAEVYGKQTTSWFASYTKDYTIVMTIAQGGTGSGASGPAVRKIYESMYGLNAKGDQDVKKALMPQPRVALPKIQPGRLDRRAEGQAVRAGVENSRRTSRCSPGRRGTTSARRD